MKDRRNSKALTALVTLAAIGGLTSGGSGQDIPRKKVNIEGIYFRYPDAAKMVAASSLVIIGIPAFDFDSEKHVGEANENYGGSFYTFRRIIVQKVLKNDSAYKIKSGDKLFIIEPATVIKYPDGSLVDITRDNYIPMTQGWKYILSLSEGAPSKWVIVNNNLGRMPYNTPFYNKSDFSDLFNEYEKAYYKQIKNDLINLFKLK